MIEAEWVLCTVSPQKIVHRDIDDTYACAPKHHVPTYSNFNIQYPLTLEERTQFKELGYKLCRKCFRRGYDASG